MSVEFEIASDQIDGARDYQEDAYMTSQLGDAENGESCVLVIMADGMGGHAAGNVASSMVISTFNKCFQSNFPTAKIAESLTESLHLSNEQIRAAVKETPALNGMGCTMVTAFLQDNKLYWISVGDSHLYLIRDNKITKHNADHSYGAYLDMMKEQGKKVEKRRGMSRNMLMSAMTGDEMTQIDVTDTPVTLNPGDRVIVASDGLDTLSSKKIIQCSSKSSTPKDCVRALLKAVEDAKKAGQDNTTLITIDVKEQQPAPEAPLKAVYDTDPKPEVSRVVYIPTPQKARKTRSSSGWIWILLILLLGAGGSFAWQQGWLDQIAEVASQTDNRLENLIENEFPNETETAPPAESATETADAYKNPQPTTIAETRSEPVHNPIPFEDDLTQGGTGPTMVQVPGGEFRMGGASGLIAADEVPRHQVSINSFMVSVYEVTFAQYDEFARATKRTLPESFGLDRNTHPVNNLSWEDALAYTIWLSEQTGEPYRLLSESEWEYVARAGTTSSYWWGVSAGSGNAHCFDCNSNSSIDSPTRVGSFKPNRFGLHDTAGNVFEWVQDCYHNNYKAAPTDGSAREGGDCSQRVARGGSFQNPASSMRAENREKFPADEGQHNVGFRLGRDL